jgi:hypothetical protein
VKAVLPIRAAMSDSVGPASDLFDEQPLHHAVGQVGAIAPMTPTRTVDEPDDYVPCRWSAAGVALAFAAVVGLVFQFPLWAVATLALFAGGMSLRRLPSLVTQAWVIVAVSFFFAQVTSIFVSPFIWPMRFGFCAVLLIGLTLVLFNGSE